jgi:Undecaprenyl-phosphate glucose phosphotransferase
MPRDGRVMVSIDDLNFAAVAASEGRSRQLRYGIGPLTALVDLASVLGVVGLASISYHMLVYGHMGNIEITINLATLIAAIFLFGNMMQGRYRLANYLSAKGQIETAFNIWNITMVAFIAIAFMAKVIDDFSRAVVIVTYLAGIPLIALARSGVVRVISMASRSGRITAQRVFLIGREAEVMSFVSRHQPWNMGFAIADVAFLRSPSPDTPKERQEADMAADLATIIARTRHRRPDAVFIAMPWSERQVIERCVDALMTTPVSIHLAPEQIMDRFDSPRISRIGSMTSLQLSRPALHWSEIMLKRVFDVLAATAILVMAAPVLLAIWAVIRLDSKGPALFVQRRYGFNQRAFRIYKFRTMTTTDDGALIQQAQKDDPRVTRIGRFLRRYNLDELPQLLNVIGGQMSLVGPRPHALAHDEDFQQRISLYARRHNVKPGITGWAQVHGLRGLTDTDEKMAQRVHHDLWYIDNWSFWLDLLILIRTVVSPKSFRNAG